MMEAADGARASLVARFVRSWGESIETLCAASAEGSEPLSEAESALLEEGDETLASELEGTLRHWLWSHHQFLELDGPAHEQLRETLERAIASLAGGEPVQQALTRQRHELAEFLRARLGPAPRDVVSAEYSPDLQLALLGLEPELRPPVLDIGCGANASLVRSLRARGLRAHGIDRLAPEDVAIGDDWLRFSYGEARFGTVLSHLGFSLYFLHHHLAGRDTAYEYARSYMAILTSLVPGGLFAYTPGLPFLETLLDASKYRVRHVPFAEALRVPVLVDIEQRTGLALSHASHVERLR